MEDELAIPSTFGRLDFLPRFKILITIPSDGGYAVVEPQNRGELKEHIMKTTRVPYLTGWGFLMPEAERDADGNQIVYSMGFFLAPKVRSRIESATDVRNPCSYLQSGTVSKASTDSMGKREELRVSNSCLLSKDRSE